MELEETEKHRNKERREKVQKGGELVGISSV
jgi:hypothetical protein